MPAVASRQRASDKQKNRLARKAELARLSRRRKKAHMAGVVEELHALRRQVAELKVANEKGVKWVDSEADKDGLAAGSRLQRMDDGCDDGSEFDSDTDDSGEDDEVLVDSPRCGDHRRAPVTSGSSLSSSTSSPSFRARDRHSRSDKRSKRRAKHRYSSDSDSDSASDTSDDSEYDRRRQHKRAKKSASPASLASVTSHASSPSASSVTTTLPESRIVTLQTISLETLDLVGNQPILSRLFLSLPLHTTSFTALRNHLLSQSFHYVGESHAFVVQWRVLTAAEEADMLAGAGVAGGGSVQLVHRALLRGVEAGGVGGVVAGGSSAAAVDVKSEEEEAARAISTLAVAAAVA